PRPGPPAQRQGPPQPPPPPRGGPPPDPTNPPAAAPPRAPMPAPFSRVVNDPPAQPATSIDPAKKSTEALPTRFFFVFIVVFSFSCQEIFTGVHLCLALIILLFLCPIGLLLAVILLGFARCSRLILI